MTPNPPSPPSVPPPAGGPVILVGSSRHRGLWVTQSALPSDNLGDSRAVHAILREVKGDSKEAVRLHRSSHVHQPGHGERDRPQSVSQASAPPSTSSHDEYYAARSPSPPKIDHEPIIPSTHSERVASSLSPEDHLLWGRMHSAVDRALQNLLDVSDPADLEPALQRFLASQRSQALSNPAMRSDQVRTVVTADWQGTDIPSGRTAQAEFLTQARDDLDTVAAPFRPRDVGPSDGGENACSAPVFIDRASPFHSTPSLPSSPHASV
ncbi:hypothetical protein C8Q76DRAFT_791312 [Earliella scabrosa]|nr:hypothetical protein C8Q76DRAFT_791312 [Earliella scabrosa]